MCSSVGPHESLDRKAKWEIRFDELVFQMLLTISAYKGFVSLEITFRYVSRCTIKVANFARFQLRGGVIVRSRYRVLGDPARTAVGGWMQFAEMMKRIEWEHTALWQYAKRDNGFSCVELIIVYTCIYTHLSVLIVFYYSLFTLYQKFKVCLYYTTLVPEVYFYYFHCEGERKNKPLVQSGNWFIEPRQSVWIRVRSWLCLLIGWSVY
jgi:hypothetical protein